MSETTVVHFDVKDARKLGELGRAVKDALDARGDAPDPDSLEARTFVFEAMDLEKGGWASGSGGKDTFEFVFKGRGPKAFCPRFASGEEADKGSKSFRLERMLFDVVSFFKTRKAQEGADPDGEAATPTIDNPPEDHDEDEAPDVPTLDLVDKVLRVRITSGGASGPDRVPDLAIVVTMSVSHGVEGIIRDLTGDPDLDKYILTPEIVLTAGRLNCRQGTLTLVRAVEAKQQTLGLEVPAALAEVKEPMPPEGVKEKTLRRGTRPAREALERAVSATRLDGQAADLAAVRTEFEGDTSFYLRTWQGGPVKVCKEFRTVYVLAMPAESAGAEGAGQGDGTGGDTGDAGGDGAGSGDTEGD